MIDVCQFVTGLSSDRGEAESSGPDSLWEHQQFGILDVVDHILNRKEKQVGLSGQPGCGKTRLTTYIAAYLAKSPVSPITRVVVVVPTQIIRDQYRGQKSVVRFGAVEDVAGEGPNNKAVISVPDIDLGKLIDPMVAGPKYLVDHVTGAGKPRVILATTMDTFRRALDCIGDMSHVLVVLDEAHRFPVGEFKAWAKARVACEEKSATILATTATMYRADGLPICPGAYIHQIPRIKLIEAGLCPSRFPVKVVLLPSVAKTATEVVDVRVKGEGTEGTLVELLTDDDLRFGVRHWVGLGCPFGLMRCQTQALTKRLKEIVEEECPHLKAEEVGRPVVDLSGKEVDKMWPVVDLSGSKVNKALEAQIAHDGRVRHANEIRTQLVVGIRRVECGFDWPPVSHVFNFGLISSETLLAQLRGRGWRSKTRYEGYPERFRDEAWLIMFVPTVSEEARTEFLRSPDHLKLLMNIAATTVNEEAGTLLSFIHDEIQKGLSRYVRGYRDQLQVIRILGALNPEPREMDEIRADLGKIETRLGGDVSVSDYIREIVLESRDEKKRGVVKRKWSRRRKLGALILLLGQKGQSKKETARLIRELLDKKKSVTLVESPEQVSDEVRSVLADALNQLVEKHGDIVTFTDTYEEMATTMNTDVDTIRRMQREVDRLTQFKPRSYQVAVEAVSQELVHCGRRWKVLQDLSGPLGLDPGTYTMRHLDRDLRHQVLKGQPEDINSLRDLRHAFR